MSAGDESKIWRWRRLMLGFCGGACAGATVPRAGLSSLGHQHRTRRQLHQAIGRAADQAVVDGRVAHEADEQQGGMSRDEQAGWLRAEDEVTDHGVRSDQEPRE